MTGRILVIGAGVSGAAVALALLERDLPVLVVEARPADRAEPAEVATAASAGMLAPQYESSGDEALLRLALASRERHPAFLEKVERLADVELDLRPDGMLVGAFGEAERDELSRMAGRQRGLGLAAELIDPGAAVRLQPGLGEALVWLWLPDESRLDTQRLAAALPTALEAAGAELRYGARVERLVTGDGSVRGVTLEGGERLAADRVVLSAGAWSNGIEGLPRPVPVRPVRGQMLRYEPGVAPPLERLVARRDGSYLVPRPDGAVLAGSTMEEAGFEATVTAAGQAGIRAAAARLVPTVAAIEPSERWAGLRPVSKDGAPILGPDPELDGLHYATGYGRNGILLSPTAAEIVAARLAGETGGAEADPFSIGRFSARAG